MARQPLDRLIPLWPRLRTRITLPRASRAAFAVRSATRYPTGRERRLGGRGRGLPGSCGSNPGRRRAARDCRQHDRGGAPRSGRPLCARQLAPARVGRRRPAHLQGEHPLRRRGVDRVPQAAEMGAVRIELLDDGEQVADRAGEAVEPEHDQVSPGRISRSRRAPQTPPRSRRRDRCPAPRWKRAHSRSGAAVLAVLPASRWGAPLRRIIYKPI
jgi:hypothetical protein